MEDPAIKESLNYIYARIQKDFHKIFDPKYGWMSKKEFNFTSKRIRNLMKDGIVESGLEAEYQKIG